MTDEQESSQNPTEPDAQSQPEAESAPTEPEAAEGGDPTDDLAAAALASAQAAIDSLNAEADPTQSDAGQSVAASADPQSDQPAGFDFPDFASNESDSMPKGMDLLSDVNVDVTIELGRTRMLVEDVLRLAEGAVVELDKLAGDPVDIYVNHRLVARGEVLVLNDNFCIRVNDILDADLVEQEA
ncbi:MAG: hypothetical protein Phyf2KO_10180 [Phycisphaerales bacterium]